MSPAPSPRSDCSWAEEHPRINERLAQMERRADKHDAQIEEVRAVGQGIREELAGMRGEIRGALGASRIAGAVIGSIVTAAVGAGLSLLRKG